MNVGLLVKELSPEAGGAYTFQQETLGALRELSSHSHHTFVIFSSGGRKNIPAGMDGERITVVPLRFGWFHKLMRGAGETFLSQDMQSLLHRSISAVPRRVLEQHRIEFFWFPTNYYLGIVDVPYMTIVWDLQHRLQPWFPEVSSAGEWFFRERYHRTLLQRATFVIAGTNAGKDEIVRFYGIPDERVRILPHPTPSIASTARVGESAEILSRLGISHRYIFYPAQFWPHKNHAVLVRAVAHLKDVFKIKLDLVLAGSDKGNRGHIESLASELRVADQVHFAGFVSRDELVALYNHALVMVYPSFFGPENMPPLEAFALGCPVIAANVSGAAEQLGDAALLFEPTDHVQLALHIKHLYQKKDARSRLVKRGKARAGKWTSKDFVAGVLALLDEFETIRKGWPA